MLTIYYDNGAIQVLKDFSPKFDATAHNIKMLVNDIVKDSKIITYTYIHNY